MKRPIQKMSPSGSERFEEPKRSTGRTQAPAPPPGAEDSRSAAVLAKGLSDENRLRILMCLRDRKRSVSSIVEEVGLSQPLVSHHLKELKRCLLVTVERNGPFIYYEAADPRILDVIKALASVATDLVAARKTI
jgi:DNA-binding transcriptional ArsR family regulator